jgi:hypothetical protein
MIPHARTRARALTSAAHAAGALLLSLCASGCGDPPQPVDVPSSGAHVHRAPHGGALFALPGGAAHVEIVFQRAQGRVELYLLDDHAHSPLRSAQHELELRLAPELGAQALRLQAVASALTGETVGNSSSFAGASSALVGQHAWSAELALVELLGLRYERVMLTWPGSSEIEVDHARTAQDAAVGATR